MSFMPDEVESLLPFAVPAALMTYALIVTLGGSLLRRRRIRIEKARRKADPRPPWDRWLDEINRKVNAEKTPGSIEKWRE